MNVERYKISNNVEQEEIVKFKMISSHWWDLEGELKTLHRINPLRLDYIIERSNGLFGKKVLDVGCGGGILSESMACEGATVTGIDMSIEVLKMAHLHSLECGIKIDYVYETIEEHTKRHMQHYDVVTCMEILEHVPDPESIVKSCAQTVRPGGQVFFSTINRNFKAWIIAVIGAEYILHMIPKGTHNVKKFIKPSELLGWIDQTILKGRHIIGIDYNLFTDKYRLAPNIDINYMLHTTAQSY